MSSKIILNNLILLPRTSSASSCLPGPCAGLSLVNRGHVTSILASDWSGAEARAGRGSSGLSPGRYQAAAEDSGGHNRFHISVSRDHYSDAMVNSTCQTQLKPWGLAMISVTGWWCHYYSISLSSCNTLGLDCTGPGWLGLGAGYTSQDSLLGSVLLFSISSKQSSSRALLRSMFKNMKQWHKW